MPSVKPFDRASPRPRPVGVVGVAESLERGEHVVAALGRRRRCRGRRRGSRRCGPRRLVDTRTRRAAGRVPRGVREHVHEHALQQHRDRPRDGGRSGSRASSTRSGPSAELVERGEHDAGGVDGLQRHGEHARLHAADVEQVGDQRRQRREALVGRRDQLGAVVRRQVRAGGAQSADGGHRGGERAAQSWLTADSRALRTWSVSARAPAARAVSVRSVCSSAAAELGDDDVERRRSEASSACPCSSSVAGGPPLRRPTVTASKRPSRTGSPSVASDRAVGVDESHARRGRTPRACG